MVLGGLPVPGRPTVLVAVGQGPAALAVGAGGGGLDVFALVCPFFPLSPSLWETARSGLGRCLKGPLGPKQPTNQLVLWYDAFVVIVLSDEPRQNQGRGLVDHKLVKAPQ